MQALNLIIEWAKNDIPTWQGDAVRRLLLNDRISENDISELISIIKKQHGLLEAKDIVPKPILPQKGMFSGVLVSGNNVKLKAIKDLKNINAIPDGSSLLFGHEGLTVIYGENGSGKSGYARVLKRACKARDTKERILPNIFNKTPVEPAKATFKISLDNQEDQEIKWQDGINSDEILSSISVFDSRCARVIVDEKNQITYLPYGTQIFSELVSLLNVIKEKLDDEKTRIKPFRLP